MWITARPPSSRALTGVDTDRLAEEKRRGPHHRPRLCLRRHPRQPSRLRGCAPAITVSFTTWSPASPLANTPCWWWPPTMRDAAIPRTPANHSAVGAPAWRGGAEQDRIAPRTTASAEVQRDIRALTAGSFLADEEIVPLSCTTGAGIADLREHLGRAAALHAATRA